MFTFGLEFNLLIINLNLNKHENNFTLIILFHNYLYVVPG